MSTNLTDEKRRRLEQKVGEFRSASLDEAVQHVLEFNKTPVTLKAERWYPFRHRAGERQKDSRHGHRLSLPAAGRGPEKGLE